VKWLLLMIATLFCGLLDAQELATSKASSRFQAVDIYIDPQNQPLAAYQLEFSADKGTAKVVGIEGGAYPAFAAAPFYDPRAIQQEHVIIAAFSTAPANQLPAIKMRVATIHLQLVGDRTPRYALKVEATATATGEKIKSVATFQERNQ
jgi:hypothetical protein